MYAQPPLVLSHPRFSRIHAFNEALGFQLKHGDSV
jgi:hypothetical protein